MKAMATNQNIAWFFQRFKEGSLELSADFQRNPVWQKPQKDYLIETILLELPVPEIYIVNRVNAAGDSKWIVVDGQQRLRTIIEFVTNELEVTISIQPFKNVSKFFDLSDDQKTRLWRYPMVIRDLEDSTDGNVRDLFQRLNKYSITLTDQELRNARFRGLFLKAVNNLSENEFWTTAGLFSANDIRRMLDLEYISILLTTMIGGIYNRKDRIDEFYIMYEKEFDEIDFYTNRFIKSIETIDALLPNIKRTRWKNKSEFYTLFLLVDGHPEAFDTPDKMAAQAAKLNVFSEKLIQIRENSEASTPELTDYLDASTYGTNDKEKRIRRLKILKLFMEIQ